MTASRVRELEQKVGLLTNQCILLSDRVTELAQSVEALKVGQSSQSAGPADTNTNKRRKKREPAPVPRLFFRITQHRRLSWDLLVIRGAMAGEHINKAGFAFKYHLNDREFRRWFSDTGKQVQPNSPDDVRIRRYMREERDRIEAKLAAMERSPNAFPWEHK